MKVAGAEDLGGTRAAWNGGAGGAAAALRIALVGPLPPAAGGMANQTQQLALLLRGDGVQVETIAVNGAYRPAWIAAVPGLRAVFRLPPYLLRLWRAAGRVQLFHVMANSGWSWHLFAAPAILVARLRGCPVVLNYRGGEAAPFLRRQAFLVGLSLRRAQALIVPSGYLAGIFGAHGFRSTVVPNVVDLQRFRCAGAACPQADRAAASARAPSLLVARHLEPIYDNACALRAFALVLAAYPAARLVVAGGGPLLAELQALARQLGVAASVTFAGRLRHGDMAGLYRQADVMLNPSLVDNTPNSVLEALASGVPVVSTNVGGVPFLVEHGRTALLVPPAAPAAMAAAVLRLLGDRQLAAALRQAGQAQVQQFCWPSVRPLLQAVYLAALRRPATSSPGRP